MFHMFNFSVIYMAKPMLQHQKLLSSIVTLLFIVIATPYFVAPQTFDDSCILDLHFPPSMDDSDCEPGNWGGFINHDCCREAFDEYLYALGKRANISGQIYLNSAEQMSCLFSMMCVCNCLKCIIFLLVKQF